MVHEMKEKQNLSSTQQVVTSESIPKQESINQVSKPTLPEQER